MWTWAYFLSSCLVLVSGGGNLQLFRIFIFFSSWTTSYHNMDFKSLKFAAWLGYFLSWFWPFGSGLLLGFCRNFMEVPKLLFLTPHLWIFLFLVKNNTFHTFILLRACSDTCIIDCAWVEMVKLVGRQQRSVMDSKWCWIVVSSLSFNQGNSWN